VYRDRSTVIRKIVIISALLLILGGGIFALHSVYTVRTVYVEGNVHYTEDEIKKIVMSGPLGNNSLYLSLKYRDRGIQDVPFVDVMNVSILAPDTIKITVYEKALAGYVKYLDTYMYFDKDGYVVESSGIRTQGVPQITGLTFNHIVLGEQLPVENPEVFAGIMDMTKLLNKYQLTADKIYFHSSGEITIYFGQIKVAMGSDNSHLEDKLQLLPGFLEQLEGKSGTLQMENYEEGKGKFTFKPDA
jgi:cell division septal protein FtsQ